MVYPHCPRQRTVPDISIFLTIPPEGAAREVAFQIASACSELCIPCKTFDTAAQAAGLRTLINQNDETLLSDFLSHLMVVQCLDFRASHLLVTALSPIPAFYVNLLKRQGIHTIHWFYEDFRRVSYWKDVVSSYSVFAAVQRGPVAETCAAAGTQFIYLPTAADGSSAQADTALSPDTDVTFIGIPSSYRVRVLESLHTADISLCIAGSGWDQYSGPLDSCIVSRSWTDSLSASALYCRSCIGLNLSFADPDTDRDNSHISPRAYTILQNQRILITEDSPLIREALENVSYIHFSDERTLPQLIQNAVMVFRGNEETRRENREKVQQHHTYCARLKTLTGTV